MNHVVFHISLEVTLKNSSTCLAKVFDAFDQRSKFSITCFTNAMNNKTDMLNRIFITEFYFVEEHLRQATLECACLILESERERFSLNSARSILTYGEVRPVCHFTFRGLNGHQNRTVKDEYFLSVVHFVFRVPRLIATGVFVEILPEAGQSSNNDDESARVYLEHFVHLFVEWNKSIVLLGQVEPFRTSNFVRLILPIDRRADTLPQIDIVTIAARRNDLSI